MAPLDPDRRSEIERVLDEVVKPARWSRTHPVELAAYHLPGEPVPYDVAVVGAFVPFSVGDPWGPAWGTTWFRVTGAVPDGWSGHDVVLVVHLGYGGGTGFGAEGQVWVDGEPTQGISPNHRDVLVAAPAVGGERVELFIEAAANPPADAADPGPLLLADPDGAPQLVLRRCHLAVVDREAEALVRDWALVAELATWVGGARAEACGAALDRACRSIEAGDVGADAVRAARHELVSVLTMPNPGPGPVHLAVGNSHLDTAWLWPLRETHRKAARTFSTAVTMLDREPDYRFAASQPQQLAWIRDEHPGLWQRIRDHVRHGRFDVVGAMWIEPDCNLPSGESLVRQVVLGKRFWRDELGVDSDGLWLPDVFGYSAAMPQILRQAGVDWFVTQKLSWNDTNRFPHHTFWWEGIDGTRIFTHFPPADTYSGDLSIPQLLHGERSFAQRDVRRCSLYLYGHGDGGGGPDQDMIERARRLRDLDGVGRVELTGAADAIARIRAEGADDELPVWVGELYLELHRGTFTTLGAIKKGNRELEGALRDTELFAWAASSLTGEPVPAAELDQAWRTLLLHQFHDILPGSSIHWVHQDTLTAHAEVRAVTDEILGRSLGAIAGRVDTGLAERPVLVANSLPWARDEVVEVDGGLHRVSAPPCGWAVADLAASAPVDAAPVTPVTAGPGWMDNGLLRVEWDDAGLLRSIRHLSSGREAVAPGGAANLLQLLEDHPRDWDAWDIDRDAFDTAVDLIAADTVELVEISPLRATLRIVRAFGRSRIDQRVQLSAGSGRVEVHCDVDWHEDHQLLKVAFPLDVRAATARHEIQFGHVERPTHRNTSWDAARFETCAHTWVDLSEEGFGVALLNDGKYGHDVLGNVVRLSLLRAPTWPDPLADRGRHRFAYALFPHAGPPTTAGVIAEAHAFNAPLRLVPLDPSTGDGAPLPGRRSLVTVEGPGVVISAVKVADDADGTIVRLHEAFGGRRRVTLHVLGVSAAERTDLLEDPVAADPMPVHDGCVELDLGPFELVTLRLR
jgi:alpha-mannosidase